MDMPKVVLLIVFSRNKGGTGTPKSSFYCTGVKTSVEFLSKVKTPTPVHSFVNIRDNSKGTGTYYAVAEGSPKDNIPPMLLEITINGGNKIHIKRT
jgi:hypothetical protein